MNLAAAQETVVRSRVFDDEEEERPAARRQDRELTLGTGTLLLLFFGLVLLCGLCFGVGFSLGERGAAKVVPMGATTAVGGGVSLVSRGNGKPSPVASAQPTAAAPIADDLATAGTDAAGSAAQAGAGPVTTGQVATGQAAAQQAEQLVSGAAGRTVQPALPEVAVQSSQTQTGVPHAALPGSQTGLQAAAPSAAQSGAGFLVQVAAVSDPADAQVLLDALKKRGYAVTLAHGVTDNLMHVQVGPFGTRAEALATRQKLLHDGYNAIVK